MSSRPPPPLGYDPTRIILRYLDPNIRIQLAQRVPFLRNTEKLIPLKVGRLEFSKYQITIDLITYSLEIYRDIIDCQKVASWNQGANDDEDLKQDFDRYFYETTNECCQTRLPFIPYLQLTIRSSTMTQRIRYPYNMTVDEAMGNFVKRIFGGRKVPVKTSRFEIKKSLTQIPWTIRPIVRNLTINSDSSTEFHSLCVRFLHESSYPLNTVDLSCQLRTRRFLEHDEIKSARQLIIRNTYYENDSWLPMLENLTNQKIFLKVGDRVLSDPEYLELIRHWVTIQKEIGSCLEFGVHSEETVRMFLAMIENRMESTRTRTSVTVPINSTSQLKISYKPSVPRKEQLTRLDCGWVMKMHVIPV